ncbi:MAG: oligoendopeptidase F [Solobacterium sp.]|nr:oligoendopeptidase F [Solobacterium sp.]
MSEAVRERKDIEEKFKWDLSSLYESDEEWEKALEQVDASVAEYAAYAGKLKDAQTIAEYFGKESELERKLDNLFCYASLRRSEDLREEVPQKMYARMYGKYVMIITALAFAQPEILSLTVEELENIENDPVMKDYRFLMEQLRIRKPHTLSQNEEELLARFAEVLGAPALISENLQDADLKFAPVNDQDGNSHEVHGSNYITLQSSNDRTLRKNAFFSFYDTYKNHINTFASTYSAAVKAAAAEAQARHYNSSREMSMAQNNIPLGVYDNLVKTVNAHLPEMYRYVALRRRLLGLEELHYYDLYAPLVKGSEERYTYGEAQKLLLEAIRPLGESYVNKVREGLDSRWIDVYPNTGKSGGAYSSGTYESNPYILTNFTGTLDSVSTITHEMGHSMHSWYSNTHQPAHYAGYTLFVAEVASTVNENLLIENLLSKTEDPQKRLVLINQYLENFKGTVYRQTMFAEFEMEAHAMAERGEALDPATLNQLYLGLIKKYFGPELTVDEEVQYEWARIPHFYRPFYVYVYATGYSSAVAISEMIRKDPKNAERYLEFLSMGGSQYPLDELKHAGVDLLTAEPIDLALNKFGALLDEAEKLAEAVKK